MFKRWIGLFLGSPSGRSKARRPPLELEPLEDRVVPSGFALDLGGTGAAASAYAVAADSSGNSYVAGSFHGTVNFNPAGTAVNLSAAAGSLDGFVAKYNAAGGLIWAHPFSGPYSDEAFAIAVDSAGNVYTTGYFQGTVDFGGGHTLTSQATPNTDNSYGDAFVCKLNSSGNYVWAEQFGQEADGDLAGYQVAVDAGGNVYSEGYLSGAGDFGPGQSDQLVGTGGGYTFYVAKLNSAGTYQWAQQLAGGADFTSGYGLALDGSGNVFAAGAFSGTASFSTGALTSSDGGNSTDLFVTKLNPATGNSTWTTQLGTDAAGAEDYAAGLAFDSAGNAYLTGSFIDTVHFGSVSLTSAGDTDGFVAKLNTAGSPVWATGFGGANNDAPLGIASDSQGNLYTTGYANGDASFVASVYVNKLNAAGSILWTQQEGPGDNDTGSGIALDSAGNVLTAGYYTGAATFHQFDGSSTTLNSNAGAQDGFVSKLLQTTTTTALTSSTPNPTTFGANVAFLVTVTPASITGNGETIQLQDNGVNIPGATGTLTNGTVTINVTSLAVGSHSITAVYSGDTSYLGNTSGALTRNVTNASTTVNLLYVDINSDDNDAAIYDEGNSRSLVDSVVYHFDTPVNLNNSAIQITLHSGVTVTLGNGSQPIINGTVGTVPGPVDNSGNGTIWYTPDGGYTWVVSFGGAGVTGGGSIADGVYDIKLLAGDVTTASGGAVSLNAYNGGNGGTGNDLETFWCLYGDANGDQKVTAQDYGSFASTYLARSSNPAYIAWFDQQGDDKVTAQDYGSFASNYLKKYTGFSATI